jgi:hypothetical protein
MQGHEIILYDFRLWCFTVMVFFLFVTWGYGVQLGREKQNPAVSVKSPRDLLADGRGKVLFKSPKDQ